MLGFPIGLPCRCYQFSSFAVAAFAVIIAGALRVELLFDRFFLYQARTLVTISPLHIVVGLLQVSTSIVRLIVKARLSLYAREYLKIK